MKTKVIFPEKNKYAGSVSEEFDKNLTEALLLALYEEKLMSFSQYEQVRRRLRLI